MQVLGTRAGGFRKKPRSESPIFFQHFRFLRPFLAVDTRTFLYLHVHPIGRLRHDPFPPFRLQDTKFLIPLKKIQLEILGLSSSQSQSGSFALILGEKGGNRRLPIIIGMFEAQSIAIQIEKISPNRPLTHDLFKSFAEHVHVVILEVVISDLKEGVFYSRIVCSDGATTFDIDARPSDAIAIGLRFGVPIYTVESVLSEAGIILSDLDEAESDTEDEDDDEDDDNDTDSPRAARTQPEPRDPSGQVSMEELSKMLSEALNREDYEKAAKIRDELNKRNG